MVEISARVCLSLPASLCKFRALISYLGHLLTRAPQRSPATLKHLALLRDYQKQPGYDVQKLLTAVKQVSCIEEINIFSLLRPPSKGGWGWSDGPPLQGVVGRWTVKHLRFSTVPAFVAYGLEDIPSEALAVGAPAPGSRGAAPPSTGLRWSVSKMRLRMT